MSGSRGGLGAFDMALLPEVFVPVSGHGLSSDEWLAPRRRLLTEMLQKGWLTLWPDLDEEYLSALHGLLCGRTVRELDETAQVVLNDLVAEVQTRRYARPTNTMPGTYDLGIRSEASKALAEAHSKLEFDEVVDCRVAMGRTPASVSGDPCTSIEDVCDRIARLPNAVSVPRTNTEIVTAVLPLACRFPHVTVTGRYFGPYGNEIGFVRELLSRLLALPVSMLRTFRCEFEGRTGRRLEAPLSRGDLRHWAEGQFGSSLGRARERGVNVEIVSWPERAGGALLERHVVVGTADCCHSGLVISHVECPGDNSHRGDVPAPRVNIVVLDAPSLTAWQSVFQAPTRWDCFVSVDPPELQSWPAAR